MSVEDNGHVPRFATRKSVSHLPAKFDLPRRQRPIFFSNILGVLLLEEVKVHGISELGHHQKALRPPPFPILRSQNRRRRARESVGVSMGLLCILDDESEFLHKSDVILAVLIHETGMMWVKLTAMRSSEPNFWLRGMSPDGFCVLDDIGVVCILCAKLCQHCKQIPQ